MQACKQIRIETFESLLTSSLKIETYFLHSPDSGWHAHRRDRGRHTGSVFDRMLQACTVPMIGVGRARELTGDPSSDCPISRRRKPRRYMTMRSQRAMSFPQYTRAIITPLPAITKPPCFHSCDSSRLLSMRIAPSQAGSW